MSPPAAVRFRVGNAALAILSLLATLAGIEGYFRCCVDTTDGAMQLLTSKRWALRHLPQPAGTWRGRRLDAPGASTVSRFAIAVVGDSITFGQGIEQQDDLYPSILERKLQERGLDADVYNISYFGWSTVDERNTLGQVYAGGVLFDLVVLGYCLNDIATSVAPPPDLAAAAELLRTPPPSVAPLVDRSFVASFLYNRYVLLTSPSIRRIEQTLTDAYRDPVSFGKHAEELREFKRLTDARGARLVVLTFPNCTTLWSRYAYRDIHRKLDAFWRGLGVTHVDLLQRFEGHPVASLRAGLLDTHPNELAHRLAAEQLEEAVISVLGRPPQVR